MGYRSFFTPGHRNMAGDASSLHLNNPLQKIRPKGEIIHVSLLLAVSAWRTVMDTPGPVIQPETMAMGNELSRSAPVATRHQRLQR